MSIWSGKLQVLARMARHGYVHLIPVACTKYLYNKIVLKPYHIHPWHTLPAEARPYAMDIIRFVNEQVADDSVVVEIGCGVGDILSKIKRGQCIGFDIDEAVVTAATRLHSNKRTEYHVGSFDAAAALNLQKIDTLICMQVLHHFSPAELKQQLDVLLSSCEIRTICVDVLGMPGYYDHDFSKLLPASYQLISNKLYDVQGPRNLIYTRDDRVMTHSKSVTPVLG